ncbi:MAG: SDR family NAD(P)-dependent oxidoreductase [Rhodosalinus sp.]
MTEPLPKPRKKDPQQRSRVPTLPPLPRSRATLSLAVAAAEGRFVLQHCAACGSVQYPPRDACHACLSVRLEWRDTDPAAQILAETRIHASPDPYFRERMPWRTGTAKLDAGPMAVVHLHGEVGCGDRVHLSLRLDRAGQGVLVALPERGSPSIEEDPMTRAMGTHVKHRRVLVTDARSEVAAPLVEALLAAGAAHVFLGEPEPWRRWAGRARFEGHEDVTLMKLDVTDPDSLKTAAGEIGGKTDILINTARFLRPGGILGQDTIHAREAMDVNTLGLMRLAQAFGPGMAARTADGINSAAAFVTLLSAYALTPDPRFGAFCASQAAARSVAQTLRAEVAEAGLRVICVYSGHTEDDWHQGLPPPKVAPKALARSVVDGLERGLEEVFCGDVAKDIAERWRRDPAVLDREIRGEGA